jgi:hypothetical protein
VTSEEIILIERFFGSKHGLAARVRQGILAYIASETSARLKKNLGAISAPVRTGSFIAEMQELARRQALTDQGLDPNASESEPAPESPDALSMEIMQNQAKLNRE